MRRQTPKLILSAVYVLALTGCAGESSTDPCSLLSVGEIQTLDGSITRSEWYPPSKSDDNEICMYTDGGGERRVMLFVWHGDDRTPTDHVQSGMNGPGIRVVELQGIGDAAAAGLRDETLKLFAAKSDEATVGLRVRMAVGENDPEYRQVADLVEHALGRIR